MVGIELTREGKPIVDKCLARRLLINCTQGKILRLMPSLSVKIKEVDKAVGILEEVFKEIIEEDSRGY